MNIDGKVSVIIPAYNEANRIAHTIEETFSSLQKIDAVFEIIVVDDGSTDDTEARIHELTRKYNNVILRKNRQNIGKGTALKVGFSAATGKYIVFLDADMELHPNQIATFFDIMELDSADIVIGSKMHQNSKIEYPLKRKIISRVYFWLVKILFGLPINDTQTGLKLFRYEVLKDVFPKILVKKFAYDLEILVISCHLGYKIAEAPVVVKSKKKWGRIGLNAIYTTWLDTLAIWYRLYILKYYDRINNYPS